MRTNRLLASSCLASALLCWGIAQERTQTDSSEVTESSERGLLPAHALKAALPHFEAYLAAQEPNAKALEYTSAFLTNELRRLDVRVAPSLTCGGVLCKTVLVMPLAEVEKLRGIAIPKGIDHAYFIELGREARLVIFSAEHGSSFASVLDPEPSITTTTTL